jgi:hypothetical protein
MSQVLFRSIREKGARIALDFVRKIGYLFFHEAEG